MDAGSYQTVAAYRNPKARRCVHTALDQRLKPKVGQRRCVIEAQRNAGGRWWMRERLLEVTAIRRSALQ
jgi:hypothetical protein